MGYQSCYFYPRSPCGERRHINAANFHLFGISIHALLAESDKAQDEYKDTVTEFLSTLSLRRATTGSRDSGLWSSISIHALLAESDVLVLGIPTSVSNFYPRSPCGERPRQILLLLQGCVISIHALLAESDNADYWTPVFTLQFLSTLSLRRATEQRHHDDLRCDISIHALLAESDCRLSAGPCPLQYFYPRSPCGERRFWNVVPLIARYFYPRSPCGERPRPKRVHSSASKFLSTLSLRRATLGAIGALIDLIFLSTLSLRRATSASKCR